MKSSTLFLVLTFIYAAWAQDEEEITSRIMGGQNAVRNQFPYIASVQLDNSHLCGGSILSRSWIVTSARCAQANSNRNFTIYAGLLNQNEQNSDNQKRNSSRIVIHPDYQSSSLANDIALIKVDVPFNITDAVKPIDVHCKVADLQIDGDVWTAGWGSTSSANTNPSNALQYLGMSLLTWQECNKLVGNLATLTERNVCGFPQKLSQGSCWKDEGNPMVQNDVLIGFNIGDQQMRCSSEATGRLPFVCTGVHSYMSFIVNTIGESKCGLRAPTTTTSTTTSPQRTNGAPAILNASSVMFSVALTSLALYSKRFC